MTLGPAMCFEQSLTAPVEIKVIQYAIHVQNQSKEVVSSADLIQLGDSLRRPVSPSKEDDAAAHTALVGSSLIIRPRRKVSTPITINHVHDSVRGIFPALVQCEPAWPAHTVRQVFNIRTPLDAHAVRFLAVSR